MPRRKAVATTPVTEPARRVKSPAFMIGLFLLGCAITAGAVLLGQSDTGQIDVAAAVRQANSNGQLSPDGLPITVPDEAFRNMPNGGLVPQEGGGETTEQDQATPSEESLDPNATTTTETVIADDSATSTPETESGVMEESTTDLEVQ